MRNGAGVLRYYPAAVNLEDIPVLVAGGGRVAERKIRNLLEAGAKVCLIAPKVTAALRRLARSGKIEWLKRRICRNDLLSFRTAIAATDDGLTNQLISRWAREDIIFVNVVDNQRLSTFISPAVFRPREGVIAVYTDGKDPGLSRDLKNYLKEHWDDFLSYRDRLQE